MGEGKASGAAAHPGSGRALIDGGRAGGRAGRHPRGPERRACTVAALSLAVMAGELAGGAWLNSLALQSDGLHAGAHAGVLLIAAGAYALARRRDDPAHAARALDLAALASGALLALAAVGLGAEAVARWLHPQPVRFGEAAALTALGLVVSGISATVLRGEGGHAHAGRRDLNIWAAYQHMLADVVTSAMALGALLLGAATGWTQLDTAAGALNAAVVAAFAARLLRTATAALRG